MRRRFLSVEADGVALTGTPAQGGGRARELKGGRRSRRRAKARRVFGAWSGGLQRGRDQRPRRWGGEAHGQREGVQRGRHGHGRGRRGRRARIALSGK
jgi:hypothetical protein